MNRADLIVGDEDITRVMQSGYKILTLEDKSSPYSVDLILSEGKLDKKRGKVAGISTFLQAPESLILAKLRMIRAAIPRERAIKDEDDISSILAITEVDLNELKRRAKLENTMDILITILNNRKRQEQAQ